MALQSSGAISISNCSVEIGWAANAQNDLNNSTMRSLANVPSGAIALSNFYGKSWNMRWSGSSIVSTYYGIETSGSSWRVPAGGWLTTYHDTFQAGTSSRTSPYTCINASGNAMRVGTYSNVLSNTWIYWTAASGFTGSSSITLSITPVSSSWGLETSGRQVRAVYTLSGSPAYGAYRYLY